MTSRVVVIGGLAVAAAMVFLPVPLLLGGIFIVLVGLLYLLLLPVILLMVLVWAIFGGGPEDPNQAAKDAMAASETDGTSRLSRAWVPTALASTIRDAGEICTSIGAVVIASQIQVASNWDNTLVGPNGEKGISQLPPDVFDKYGEDTNDNGRTSATDPKDSIMAQGEYMCDLAKQAQRLLDGGRAIGSVLDLTLAAYHGGMDAVREAGGVPDDNGTKAYIYRVRGHFGQYMGVLGEPHESPTVIGWDPKEDEKSKSDDNSGGSTGDGGQVAEQQFNVRDPGSGGSSSSGQTGEVLSLVNEERAKAGCDPVRTNSQLTTTAQRHSEDQADHQNMSHTGSDGSNVGQRIDRTGYSWSTYGENVAINRPDAEAVMQAWMNSTGHRNNILNCAFTELGVGMSTNASGTYWTQVFAAPK
ncbi:CAP domain-containing protein [Micromonospora sp. NPDC000207]|uniref:CAP domain-containing protein n=1 Tax=Micromonospora sp. NPDC000207 TaxID=3154246 RepID=UPI00332DF7A7